MKPRLLAHLASLGLNSPHFRFLNYLPVLEQYFDVTLRGGRPDKETLELGPTDILFIQKKIPRLAWTLWRSRPVKARIVYDFDDAIWTDARNPGSWSLVRRRVRLDALLKRCHLVTAANQFLGSYARRISGNVEVVPMAIAPPDPGQPIINEPAKVGWAGHPVGHYLLKTIESELREFSRRRPDIQLVVLSGERPDLQVPFEWRPYSAEAEQSFFREIDVGLVPSSNSTFDMGKTPLKAIQHFSNARPVITNGRGATRELVDDSTGYLVDSPDQWQRALDEAINDPAGRLAKGLRGYQRIRERHEIGAVGRRLTELLVSLSRSGA